MMISRRLPKFAMALLAVAPVSFAAEATPPFRSVYTDITGANCRFVANPPGVSGDVKRCMGVGGFQPETAAEHTWVTLRIRTPGGSPTSTIFRGLTVGTRVEWRMPSEPSRAAPAAAIVRVVPKDMDTLDPGGAVLVVIRLERASACMAAVVDARANPDANAVARQAADAAANFVCGRDQVATHGPATRWTAAVIDWPKP